MNKYQSYKPSGVEWIGNIPKEWRVSKFKYVSKLYTGNSLNDEQKILYESNDENDIPYVSSKDIDLNTRSVNYNNGLRIPKENNNLKVSPKDSFLLCVEGGSSGRKMVYLERDVCFVNKLCSFKSVENTRFQYYFIQSSNFQDKFKFSLSGLIGGVSISTLRDFELVLPSLNEQDQIVKYLDDKTVLIDRLISTKEQKLTLLKEQRTTLINQVVTKGLNPNVKMKDSGVEWIGEIPESWLLGKIKFLSEVISKGTTPSTVGRDVLEEGNIFYVKVENIKEGYVGVPPSYFIDEETDKILRRSSLKENDILVVITGSTIGKVVILPKQFTPSNTNQGISFIRLKNKSNVRFVWYWLSTEIIQDRIRVVCTQSTQPNLSMEDLGNFSIPLPIESEQNQIVDYLDSKTKEIDDLVQLEQKKIDLLKEYRQSLISEVVTGKVKVTN